MTGKPIAGFAPWAESGRRPRAFLLGSGQRQNVLAEAERLRPVLDRHVDIVLSDFYYQEDLSQQDADLAVVLGGDGSILRAVLQMRERQIPILGVNLGRLAFLASTWPDQLAKVLPEVASGRCQIALHLMFECTVERDGQPIAQTLGLNEIAIFAGEPFSLLSAHLYVDAELATTYSCDGLIISTPVGSTAHSLSAGGPILRKTLQAFVICPICPHTLTVRPVVDTADRVYEVVVPEPNEGTTVVVDGRPLARLTAADRVRVVRAEPTFKLVECSGQNYYRTLRDKLGWAGNIYRDKPFGEADK